MSFFLFRFVFYTIMKLTFKEILDRNHLLVDKGKTVSAHTHLVVKAMEEYLAQSDEPAKEEELPVLIGHLNRYYGFGGYQEAEPGTDVFEFKNMYQITVNPLVENQKSRVVVFNKGTKIKQHINFL